MLESIVKEAPDVVEVHVQLATAYNRLKRTDDARRERAIVDRLNAEAQAKQRGDKAPNRMSGVRLRGGRPRSQRPRCVAAQSAPPPKPGAQRRGERPPSAKAPARNRLPARAEFDRLVKAATEARQAERWEEAIGLYAQGAEAEAWLRGGLLVSGHGVLHARRLHPMPGGVPQRRAACAEERRGARVSRSLRVRAEGLRPLAAAPAAVARSSASATRRISATSRAITRPF